MNGFNSVYRSAVSMQFDVMIVNDIFLLMFRVLFVVIQVQLIFFEDSFIIHII